MGEPTLIADARPPEVAAREAGLHVASARKAFQSAEGDVVHALDGVDLDIRRGEFFILLGPSGCGKTTLLRAIAGLEELDAGEIYLGDDRIDQVPSYRRPVNTVFQSYALFPHLTVAQNVAFGLEMDRLPKAQVAERVTAMLELVQLPHVAGRRPSQLSGGQQQRVALARALAKRPQVLLLDEPLSALDLKLRRGMQSELKRLQRETGITFVFVTHDQEEALAMGDRIVVFESGKPAQVGTPEEIYTRPVNRFVADFIGDTNFVTAAVTAGGGSTTARIDSVDVPVAPDSAVPGGAGGSAGTRDVTLAVRPEQVRLVPADAGTLTGTLTALTYMGTDLRCVVELGDGQTLRSRVSPPFDLSYLKPGEAVGVVVAPDAIRVVAD